MKGFNGVLEKSMSPGNLFLKNGTNPVKNVREKRRRTRENVHDLASVVRPCGDQFLYRF